MIPYFQIPKIKQNVLNVQLVQVIYSTLGGSKKLRIAKEGGISEKLYLYMLEPRPVGVFRRNNFEYLKDFSKVKKGAREWKSYQGEMSRPPFSFYLGKKELSTQDFEIGMDLIANTLLHRLNTFKEADFRIFFRGLAMLSDPKSRFFKTKWIESDLMVAFGLKEDTIREPEVLRGVIEKLNNPDALLIATPEKSLGAVPMDGLRAKEYPLISVGKDFTEARYSRGFNVFDGSGTVTYKQGRNPMTLRDHVDYMVGLLASDFLSFASKIPPAIIKKYGFTFLEAKEVLSSNS